MAYTCQPVGDLSQVLEQFEADALRDSFSDSVIIGN